MSLLLPNLRTYLIAEGLVRDPDVAGAAAPLFLAPANGVPAPGEGASPALAPDLVVGAYRTGGFPPARHLPEFRTWTVDFRIRARLAAHAEEFETQLTAALIDRFVWPMGELTVIESQQWRELQPLGSDHQGYEYVVAYWFELYAEQLAA